MNRSRSCGVVTLTTDFGLQDPFVGVMKGVVLQRFPSAQLIDLTHQVRAQAIDEAGFWLERCYAWFPSGSVHVAVVDPGVGTSRAALAAATNGHFFLAPDNGLLSRVLASASRTEVRRIDTGKLGLGKPSRTFHGRDVFAPVAAMLASGECSFDALGPMTLSQARYAIPEVHVTRDRIEGHIAVIDRFGNLITDIKEEHLGDPSAWRVLAGDSRLRVCRTYGEANAGECIALVNSFGCLEIAVRDGSAAENPGKTLGWAVGQRVVIERQP